ncbi:MAG: hypothetical protein ACXWLM_08425 [Myxococcales bacterium]
MIAGLSLIGLGARAEDSKDEVKAESHHDKDGTFKHKKVTKSRHAGRTDTKTEEHKMDKNISGGTTETKEMKSDHEMGNMKHHKMEKKETIKRDKNGNVVEKKDEAK